MSRAEKLKERLAGNMQESLGVRLVKADDGPGQGRAIAQVSPEDGRTRDRTAGHMELERIIPDPDQPRKTFAEESIAQLAESLKKAGQLQPIRVRWNDHHGKWVIISGERRYRAAMLAGMKTIACQFVDRPLTESEIRQESLIENLLREDLKPIEAAEGYRQLIEMNAWTVQQVADALNVSKGSVSKALSLLKLPPDIRAQVDEGAISPSAAYEVSRLPGEGAQRELAARIVTEGLKRDEAGIAVGKAPRPRTKAAPASPARPLSTTRHIQVEGARVTVNFASGEVRPGDLARVLEEALAQVRAAERRGPASEAA